MRLTALALSAALLTPLIAAADEDSVPPVTDPLVKTECGECHMAFQSAFLPAASWRKIILTLDNHFGEDASLDEETARDIAAYLAAYAGEYWDTEAANRFSTVDPKNPWQISASPYWIKKHSQIKDDVYKRKGVRLKANCAACHKDSGSGRFDDQKIRVPKE